MRVQTTEGTKVIGSDADRFKGVDQVDLPAAMEKDAAERNKRAEELGIQARYEVA